ncbi:MAG: DNA-binding protein [Nevskiaceae bacterium]|nr:MAG: DNA-binding protein [Nevskiaceae bacterium]
MRPGVNLADITRAADQLLAEGERPTVEGVRKILGTGSPATVNNLLKEYYAALPSRLTLPAGIATAAAALYQQIRDAANAEASEKAEAQQQELAADRERLAQERRAFEIDRIRLVQQVAGLEADKQAATALETQLNTRVSTLERSLAEQTERAAGAESRAAAATQERERAAQKHAAELQHVRDQAAGNERHFLGRIEDQQTQIKKLGADREKEAQAAQQRVSALEFSLSDANKQTAGLRNELAAAQRDLIQERTLRQDRERAHGQEVERATRETLAVGSERDRLKTELEQITATGKLRSQERDDALREAARQEGKLQAQAKVVDELRQELATLRKAASSPAKGS